MYLREVDTYMIVKIRQPCDQCRVVVRVLPGVHRSTVAGLDVRAIIDYNSIAGIDIELLGSYPIPRFFGPFDVRVIVGVAC